MMSKGKIRKSMIGYRAAMVLFAVLICFTVLPVSAASPSASSVVASMKKKIGSSKFPFSSSNAISSSRRVFGVTVSDMDSYQAYEKTTGSGSDKVEYIVFVGKAKSKSAAKSAKSSLKKYIKNESESMSSYLSSTGKKVFKGAQIGYKKEYVWAVMLKSKSVNKDAVKAVKKAIG